MENGEFIKVGVNKYTMDESHDHNVELHEYDEEMAATKIAGLQQLKRDRNSSDVGRSLKTLEKTVKNGGNVMPDLVDCCLNYATVEEMAGIFKEVYGEFKEPNIF